MALDNRRNRENVYTSNLIEKNLAKDNTNKAYRRVVRNKDKYGINRMSLDDFLPYLKK